MEWGTGFLRTLLEVNAVDELEQKSAIDVLMIATANSDADEKEAGVGWVGSRASHHCGIRAIACPG
jgi:hypothetical protein